MPAVEDVVIRFLTPWEAAESAHLAQGAKSPIPPGQELVGIGLMTRIPDDPVAWRLEDSVEGQRQLDHSQG
jgi:hypothetical protein